jgi:hypothetical protein
LFQLKCKKNADEGWKGKGAAKIRGNLLFCSSAMVFRKIA